ncbi:MAG: hypothetical protein MUP15_00135 [Dehalococcoidia bacterium]|jgi:hypothetical protein|nr:hypothetical protein [Dehalococcoidia bacterium]
MSRLAIAVERQEWTVVALYLLLGVAEVAAKLPPDAVTGLLELLEGPPRGRR